MPTTLEQLLNDTCGAKGLILPIIPFEGTWNPYVRGSLYMAGLLYCFMGVAIVADIFMGAIEKITSKTRKVSVIRLSSAESLQPSIPITINSIFNLQQHPLHFSILFTDLFVDWERHGTGSD